MFRYLSAAVMGLFLLALPVQAQAQAASEAEARAHADQIIANSGGAAFFSNITDSDMPTVLHIPSGMVCEFPGADERDNIRLFQSSGMDVGCSTWIGRTFVTFFATRYDEIYSEEEVMGAAVRAIQRNTPGAHSVDGAFDIRTLPGQETPLLTVFDLELDGREVRSLILVRHIGEWSFKVRATGPSGDDSVVELSSMAFSIALQRADGLGAAD
jgi:hypothetical protein